MTETLDRLRGHIGALEVRDGRRVFPPQLKREILEYSKAQVAEGVSKRAVAMQLGMSDGTLHRWCKGEGSPVAPQFMEVAYPRGGVHKSPSSGERVFEVVCPNGFEVRVPASFDVAGLRQLLGALGET